jgi:hypothetical protein
MKTENSVIDPTNDSGLKTIPANEWNSIIDSFYVRFCTGEARDEASTFEAPKHNNLLIRLHEFSTVIEANRAMKAGDIGRLLLMWKKWSLMSQSLKGIHNYSSYLPRLVLLVTQFLPPSPAKLIRHSLLISPSGRKNHFVAKDYYLELQNYWLKFLFNQTGVGTRIERLKNLYSMNTHLVRPSGLLIFKLIKC